MVGLNNINRRRANVHKITRQHKAAFKARSHTGKRLLEKAIATQPLPLNAHQRKMLHSDPKANIALSKKKQKKLLKAARCEMRRCLEKEQKEKLEQEEAGDMMVDDIEGENQDAMQEE